MRVLLFFSLILLYFGGCHGNMARNLAQVIEQLVSDEAIVFETIMKSESVPEYNYNIQNKEASDIQPVVGTTSGTLFGVTYEESHAFYSIPYAEAPVGDLRFKSPKAISPPRGDIDCSEIDMKVCYQSPADCNNGVCIHNLTEDCLVLNVHTPVDVNLSDPTKLPTERYPVMFWLHGGGFFQGGATVPEFEARWLSQATGTVVVTVNYRLGPFGFLVYDDGVNKVNGNQGLEDQRLALQWVQENIEAFGGDKSNVMLFGNSAGAQSVHFHMISEKSRPLFHRGLMESNPAVFKYQYAEQSIVFTKQLMKFVRCEDDWQCLVNTDPEKINRARFAIMPWSLLSQHDLWGTVEPFRPTIDGVEFTKQPMDHFRDGDWSKDKKVIIGTNTEELYHIEHYFPPRFNLNAALFRKFNTIIMGEDIGNQVTNRYTRLMQEEGIETYNQLLGVEGTHAFFSCPSRTLARFAKNTKAEDSEVYLYVNAHPMAGDYCYDVVDIPEKCGLCYHGSEPPYVFRSGPVYGLNFYENDTDVANQFDTYWGNFAWSGSPSGVLSSELGEHVEWPQYEEVVTTYRSVKRKGNVHSIDSYEGEGGWPHVRIESPASSVGYDYLKDICDFWDDLGVFEGDGIYAAKEETSTSTSSSTTTTSSKTTSTSSSTTHDVTNMYEETTSSAGDIKINIAMQLVLLLLLSKWI